MAKLYVIGLGPGDEAHLTSAARRALDEAALLETDPGTPLVRLHEVIFDQRGRPLHNSVQLIRGERFVFRI